AGQESIVQSFKRYPRTLQLSFGPFMPVEAQFDPPRRIAAHFDEQRTKVLVVDVKVVVIDVDRLIPVELELAVHLLPLEALGFLLSYSNEDDPIAGAPFSPKSVGN